MKYLSDFRDGKLAKKLADDLHGQASRLNKQATFMEVCGTHTMSIYRHGIRTLIPENIRLVSGPGCPVCVTPTGYVDAAIELARRNGFIITTFGDMIRVPGSDSSLIKERAKGADIRIVYSPMDAVDIANNNPQSNVVFLGVGFETTAPAVAASILTAERENIPNYTVLAAHKVMPEPMAALTEGELGIDGYICPAHVSAIIGESGYKPLVEKRRVACVITGFEPLDILRGISMLTAQVAEGRAEVENEYNRVVKPEGNLKAQAILKEVFKKSDAIWRGLGSIPGSGLAISDKYIHRDAAYKWNVEFKDTKENPACICGLILKGLKQPADGKIFGSACTPDNPIGACMVSSEGTCAAEWKYGAERKAYA